MSKCAPLAHEKEIRLLRTIAGLRIQKAAMLEALEYALIWLDVADRFKYPVGYGEGSSPQQARDKVRNAIALARGEA